MNVLPIISRELRAESRNRGNYLLRLFGGTLSSLLLAVFLWDRPDTRSGTEVFAILNFAVFCSIWIAVPIIAADCLSREKREGTLGLLFLTPLKPIEIVLGKGTIHAIRSLTLLVAVVPIMTIPFILGGITKSDVLWSLLFNLSALAMSLAAGLLASSFCRQWARALILAGLFSATSALAFLETVMATFFSGFSGNTSLWDKLEMLVSLFFFSTRRWFPSGATSPSNEMVPASTSLLITALLVCLLVLLFAASRLKNSWQENPLTARQLRLRQIFCTPRFWTGFLRRSNQARLSRNPIGWLQQYSWSARLSKWGWCAVMIAMVSWFLAKDLRTLSSGCVWLKTALLVSMAFSAVGSFQREKQNGALELLLVTPLREKQIILGRLWGIWGQFLPAFGILLLAAVSVPDYSAYGYYGRGDEKLRIFGAIRDFTVVPLVGLYFAMRLKNFMAAWLLTCVLTLFLPSFVLGMGLRTLYRFGFYSSHAQMGEMIGILQMLLMTSLGVAAVSLLHWALKNRTFALGRS